MKKLLTLLLFCLCLATYAQTDSLALSKKNNAKKFGVSVFGGLGMGAKNFDEINYNNWGYVKAVSTRLHYGIHTINVNVAQLTPAEQPVFGRVTSTTAFNMHNFGLSYGVGTYGKHFSMGCLVGVNYTTMTTINKNMPALDIPTTYNYAPYSVQKYYVVNACFGLHATVKTKYIGIGYQMYYNLLGCLPSCYAALGIEVTLK